MALSVSFVSGWSVAGGSMATAYDESFEKYNIEDGNFELYAKADDELIKAVEGSDRYDAKIYENFYVEFPTKEVDSTLRIFKKRTDINLECLMDGEFPSSDSEIAIDRMYADNNSLKVGDKLTLHGKEYRICGLVALSDYSALFSSPSDMMFDSIKFGVAIVTTHSVHIRRISCIMSIRGNMPSVPPIILRQRSCRKTFLTSCPQKLRNI